MARLIFLIVLHIFFSLMGGAQTILRGADIPALVEKLPAVAANTNEAYNRFFPKGKKTVYQQAEDLLMAQINILANESNHKSRLLSMIAGRYEQEGQRIDFSNISTAKDGALDKKMQEANQAYFYALDNFQRVVNQSIDSIRQKNEPALLRTEHELQVYREQWPVFAKKVKQLLSEMHAFLDKKGYNAVLDNRQSSHVYYVQLLEVRGLLLDRLRELNKIAGGVVQSAATVADMCTKNPDICK